MINKIRKLLNGKVDLSSLNILEKEISQLNINSGKILSDFNLLNKKDSILKNIQRAEFKVYSQWGDDGIVNFLINYLEIHKKTFVEFGVENYTECNTKFLLINDNWSGLVIDGSKANMDSIRNEDIYWRYDLTALDNFVTAENINSLLVENKFHGEQGLYHIDIDGNDYWIWKATEVIDPVIVIVEYNSIFGFENPWTIPYDPSFIRSEKHYSNLYYGTSLLSICDLAEEKGYAFIGCNSNGNNAYFVRKDKLKDLVVKSPEEGYVLSKFSESRDKEGNLTYLKQEARLNLLRGMDVYNTRTNTLEKIR